MFSMEKIREIVARVEYKDWSFSVVQPMDEGIYLQIHFTDPDSLEHWTSRKWLLSRHMTESELVQTALLAVQVAEEHETREKFKYDGNLVYGPHYNVNHLADLIETGQIKEDVRT